ncbi:hypothetical protein [Streptomyces sp. NBC_00691]|uniref:hypothetical protein n=1 Tax=Streptomyces sp. NBC_00691 TaxID=2903671 RepID=UPI002E3812B1|nr:hypothetical protein [Streptomyces sp. NBC_00691]
MTELWAHTLTWAEVDPSRHPFELDEDAAKTLTGLVAPLLPSTEVAEQHRGRSLVAVTEFLVDRYGRWACGWNWSIGEGDTDGGIVEAWCCTSHSVTTAEETAPSVVAGLLEWRDWLEDLAERFATLAPPSHSTGVTADPWHWERACTRLVTVVADRTQAESGWYGHCEQVLGWFLAYNGVDDERAGEIAEGAIGGRFGSWISPDATVVDAVSSKFAGAMGETG